jgi:hypothetical protein
MSGFDFLFSFYSLLLGLAVARVATGFADMWRGRKNMVIGISPILLGLFILFSAAQQWMLFWEARSVWTMGPWPILVSIGLALPYVFVSQAMLPREQDTWASLEDYYMAHSRVLIGALLVPPVITLCYDSAPGDLSFFVGCSHRGRLSGSIGRSSVTYGLAATIGSPSRVGGANGHSDCRTFHMNA